RHRRSRRSDRPAAPDARSGHDPGNRLPRCGSCLQVAAPRYPTSDCERPASGAATSRAGLERPTPRPRVSRHGLRELAQRRTDPDSSGADMAGSNLALLEDHMALPERELQPTVHDAIVDTMRAWLREIGGARLTDTINWQVFPFDVHDPLDE